MATSKTDGKCGHVNMHARDEKGKLTKPACIKDKGHSGNHTDGQSEWKSMAGTPVEEITPEPLKKAAEVVGETGLTLDQLMGEE